MKKIPLCVAEAVAEVAGPATAERVAVEAGGGGAAEEATRGGAAGVASPARGGGGGGRGVGALASRGRR